LITSKFSILTKRYFRWILISAACGFLAGLSSTIFLITLNWATQTRNASPAVIWGLPIAGLLIGWLYHRFGKEASKGNNLIIDEMHDPKKVLPLNMAPLVLGGTLLTHLFGGSAGREGTAVQMGASLSDQLSRFFKIEMSERKILLAAGAGAGFGAAIGTPWAGVIFGMEMINVGKFKLFAWFECLIASFVGFGTAILLHAPHSAFPSVEIDSFNFIILLWICIAGIGFGLTARLFTLFTHFIEWLNQKFIPYPPLRPFFGGLIIVVLYYFEGSYRYVGLGIPVISDALTSPDSIRDPILKSIFTMLTVGSGFKGGEFIPLVFIGTTLGSALSVLLPVSVGLLSAVGFAAVFAGAANTPIACTVMAIEIFGIEIAPYALIACIASYMCSGRKGIYRSQK
tara:strand:+ start:8582 stop:9778 length:1197 start_codon:yes stop_codon:yes gene_type:complete